MNQLLEVREFDSITCKQSCADGVRLHYLEAQAFEELLQFIRTYCPDESGADVLDFFTISYKRSTGTLINIKNYVGLIQLKCGQQIQILPKVSFGDNEAANDRTRAVFLRMLRSLQDFPGKSAGSAGLRAEHMNLYEVFIQMYLQDVRKLVKHGIQSAYIRQEANQPFFKGKLLVSQHIRANAAHQERFYMAYDEFHPNRAENRLIKATLLKLQKLTTSAENAKEIRQFLSAFALVEPSVHVQKDFSEIVKNRSTILYNSLMDWSAIFLTNRSFSVFSGDTVARALLFPMEAVYESYVAQQVKKVFSPDRWQVTAQDRQYYLFTEPRKQFALRPDLVLRKDNHIVVMDTKWKRLTNNPHANYGISQADMYQMYAYSKKYNAKNIWLLYPLPDGMDPTKTLCFDSGDGTVIRAYFVDVANIVHSLQALKSTIEKTE